jgi:hypothetical protein
LPTFFQALIININNKTHKRPKTFSIFPDHVEVDRVIDPLLKRYKSAIMKERVQTSPLHRVLSKNHSGVATFMRLKGGGETSHATAKGKAIPSEETVMTKALCK